MVMLLTLIYASFLWLIFGQFKLVSLTKWTGLAALLVGVFVLGFILITMNFCQPYTPDAQFYFRTTPIVAEVKGLITEVPVKPDQPLTAGDVLFKIKPDDYQIAVDTAKSALDQARNRYAAAKREYDRNLGLLQSDTISKQQADLARDSAVVALDEQHRLESILANAQYDLDRTVVKAPTDGFVTQMRVEPGTMAVPMPLSPVMTFVNDREKFFIAAFKQNVLQELHPGNTVEIAFDAVPGKIFTGEVDRVLPVIAEGQLAPGANLLSMTTPLKAGRVAVLVKITSDLSAYQIPAGAAAQACVYTGKAKPTEIIRKILLRMESWKNYLFLP